jgi:hypothetical protein
MVLALDFDGVCHDFSHPKPGRRMGMPVENAIDSIKALKAAGHTIIVHTVWSEDRHSVIKDWMNYYSIPFNGVTRLKPLADIYLDDHGLKFTDWPTALEDIYGTSTKTG